MLKQNNNSKVLGLIILIWAILSAWFVYISATHASGDMRLAFGATYGSMALVGGGIGLVAAKRWGGLKSKLGKTIIFLSLGLLAAEFGQIVFSYYNIILHVDVPYPSLADVGFFMNIPLYIIALTGLWQVSGTKYSLTKQKNKTLILVLPLIGLIMSYSVFLRGYDFTDAPLLRVFLDFGYPLGQAIYVTIALSIFLLSVGALGGIMKKRILMLILAFAAQYAADFNFLYQNIHETWINGGYGDYLYFLAYTFMALSLVGFMSLNLGNSSSVTSASSTEEKV